MYTITDNGIIIASGEDMNLNNTEVAVRLTPVAARVGDVNCDQAVNVDDLLGVINAWGDCPKGQACQADLNQDGIVNSIDLLTVLADWG